MSTARIGKPRRHPFGAYVLRDEPGPGLRLLESDERHGSDLAGAMAALAVLLKNGEHVAVEGGRRRVLCMHNQRGATSGERDQKNNHSTLHAASVLYRKFAP